MANNESTYIQQEKSLYPNCICNNNIPFGYYTPGCPVHDDEAFKDYILNLLATMSETLYRIANKEI